MVATTATADQDECPQLEPLRRALAELTSAVDPWREPREVFAESPPNPTLEGNVGPLVASFFLRPTAQPGTLQVPDGCEHTLICRGSVCEITILRAVELDRERDACGPRTPPDFRRDRLSSGMNNTYGDDTPVYDPLSRRSFERSTLLWRFERDDGQPVPAAERAPLPKLTYDFGAPPPSPPAGLTGTCLAAARALQRRFSSLRDWIMEMEPQAVFEASRPDSSLAARVSAWAARVLETDENHLPFEVACRARVCALTPSDEGPQALVWTFRDPRPGIPVVYMPAPDPSAWPDRLERAARPFGRLRGPRRKGVTGPVLPAWLTVGELDRPIRPPGEAVVAFAKSFDWRAMLQACSERFPETGTLELLLRFPRIAPEDSYPGRVAVHLSGDKAGTALGRCVTAGFETAAARFTVPLTSNGTDLHTTLEFPFDPAPLQGLFERIEKRAQADRSAPRP
jgi:hypothetical protein